MPAKTAAQVARRIQCVASLPAIYERVNAAVNNPRSSLADVATIISDDTGLTGRLLKLVNSAFFGFPSKVDSVGGACVVVGAEQIRGLALSTSVVSAFKALPKSVMDMESFWRHTVGCGMASRVLAKLGAFPNPERFFVAGVIHDIGRLAILQEFGVEAGGVIVSARSGGELGHYAEKAAFGFDHAEVGRELLTLWQFPPSLVDSTGFHHSPGRCLGSPIEAAIVHVGDVVAHAMGIGDSGNAFVPSLSSVAWDKLGGRPDFLEMVFDEVDKGFEEVAQLILG